MDGVWSDFFFRSAFLYLLNMPHKKTKILHIDRYIMKAKLVCACVFEKKS